MSKLVWAKRWSYLAFATTLALSGCRTVNTCGRIGDARDAPGVTVTFQELNREPSKYEGQWVRIEGEVSSGFEAQSLIPEDAPVVAYRYRGLGLPGRGFFGHADSRLCNGRRVSIVGVYREAGDPFDVGGLYPIASVRVLDSVAAHPTLSPETCTRVR